MLLKLNKKWDAYWIYLLIKGTESLAFTMVFTVNLVYQATQVGLNPLQLVLVGTALEVTAFLGEIPTGVVADVYSRRLSVLLGYSLMGLGFFIEGSFPIFEAIILSAIVMGIGFTFLSGATSAWIVDEIGQERAADAFVRASQVAQILGFIGIFVSIALASISLQLAIISGGIILIALVLLLILVMPEDGFQRTHASDRESWTEVFSTFRDGVRLVRGRQILLWILLISMIYGAFTEGFDRLWTVHILTEFTLPSLGGLNDIVWFGIISAVFAPVTLIATELLRRNVDFNNSRAVARVLSVVYISLIGSVLLFAQSQHFLLVLLGLWITGSLRTVRHPLMEAWINQHTESNVRATVLSINGQADAFGQIGGGPVVGFVGTVSSVRIAISLSALMLSPLIWVFSRALKQET